MTLRCVANIERCHCEHRRCCSYCSCSCNCSCNCSCTCSSYRRLSHTGYQTRIDHPLTTCTTQSWSEMWLSCTAPLSPVIVLNFPTFVQFYCFRTNLNFNENLHPISNLNQGLSHVEVPVDVKSLGEALGNANDRKCHTSNCLLPHTTPAHQHLSPLLAKFLRPPYHNHTSPRPLLQKLWLIYDQ